MQLIIISGPSGSGKTTLSEIIIKKIEDGIILNTDNYYRKGIINKILSKIVTSYFDRKISFNLKLFKKDIEFILKNGFSNLSYKYDFKNQSIKKILKKTSNIRFIIVEGIFGKEIFNFLSSKDFILIKLEVNKQCCMNRVIKRDIRERGKSKDLAESDFIKAWNLFYKNEKKNNARKYLKKFVLKDKRQIKNLLCKISKLLT